MGATTNRRVVTGHDGKGLAVILNDTVLDEPSSKGQQIWTTVSSPAKNSDETDGGLRKIGVTLPDGAVSRVGELEPGVRSSILRTHSIDYGVVP
ncbi:hypothetical protein ACIQPR_47020 [Streptomyces sp. NPDC091280]|uniref:hypothetical protein n=1 Tax=Streptomyces sp. NPDC091280 TaxID=3365984 RepID=UPI00382F0E9B